MWPTLYSDHFESPKASMLFNTNLPLKCGHPSNKDTFTGPKAGRFRGVPLYVAFRHALRPIKKPSYSQSCIEFKIIMILIQDRTASL